LGTREDVQSFKDAAGNPFPFDSRYDYNVFTDSDLMNIARNQTPGWNGGFWSDYYRHIAKEKL
jgi:hypothetical protein